MLVSQMSSVHVNLDPDTLHWTDGNMQSIYCNYLRLFYVEDGNAAREVIGEWMGTKTIYYRNDGLGAKCLYSYYLF